ncbi:MAG: zinc-dependent alcohol dehydrogenase family protein [Novosphingobium sp.]
MKAVRLFHPAGLDNLRLEEVADAPAPGPGEITVRLRAAALNFRDGLVVKGFFPADDGLVPLSDAAGDVVAVGAGVTGFAPGDAVVSTFHPTWAGGHIDRAELNATPGGPAQGYACELATRSAAHFTLAPRGLSHAEAATLTCAGVTAWRALIVDGPVRPGETVLVQGAGGVSLFALQFAKAAGARVIATSSSADRCAKLQALGADHVINYREVENWGEAALALTDGLGVDHIVEVGGPHTMRQSMVAARTGGHIAVIGAVGGFDIDTIPFAILQAKRLRVQGVTVGSRRDQIDMIRAIEAHGIRPVIDSRFPLERLGDAFRHLDSGGHFGKIVVEI